jgi:hypothetical protein
VPVRAPMVRFMPVMLAATGAAAMGAAAYVNHRRNSVEAAEAI